MGIVAGNTLLSQIEGLMLERQIGPDIVAVGAYFGRIVDAVMLIIFVVTGIAHIFRCRRMIKGIRLPGKVACKTIFLNWLGPA